MKIKWNGNFQENMFENLGIPQEVVLFFGNYANSPFSPCDFLFIFYASSFGRDHSELDITRKDDGDAYSKMKIL